ncbi:hypothetical protein IMZ48_01000, partial [Candidatus Bathyarchaeota archaeon]|nr:hypothetical protein [Candidatus Bathyarchaeota archaeon]
MERCAACHTEGEGYTPSPLLALECCGATLCASCLAPAITANLETQLFDALCRYGCLRLPCPVNCPLGMRTMERVTDLRAFFLRARISPEAREHVEMFRRAMMLQAELSSLEGLQMGREKAALTLRLHSALHKAGVARHIFAEIDGDVEVGSVTVLSRGLPVQVPVFTSLLYRGDERTCAVCAEDRRDALILNPGAWKHLAESEFGGNLHLLAEWFPR